MAGRARRRSTPRQACVPFRRLADVRASAPTLSVSQRPSRLRFHPARRAGAAPRQARAPAISPTCCGLRRLATPRPGATHRRQRTSRPSSPADQRPSAFTVKLHPALPHGDRGLARRRLVGPGQRSNPSGADHATAAPRRASPRPLVEVPLDQLARPSRRPAQPRFDHLPQVFCRPAFRPRPPEYRRCPADRLVRPAAPSTQARRGDGAVQVPHRRRRSCSRPSSNGAPWPRRRTASPRGP